MGVVAWTLVYAAAVVEGRGKDEGLGVDLLEWLVEVEKIMMGIDVILVMF